ncbi:MAG: hypothetical protein WCB58_06290 [Acidobacteriaceae bacterium]
MNDDLISILIVLVDMNTWLFRFSHMRLKSIASSLADLHIQSIARLIDEVVAILDEQPNLFIGASCVLAREIQIHRGHRLQVNY